MLALTAAAHADEIRPDDLARKNDGGYFTGLPLVAYTTDIGLGGGARVYYYWNGHRDDPRFAQTPYLHRIFLQAFFTTRKIQFHWLDYDAPAAFGSKWRIRAQAIYGRNVYANYFGLGNVSARPLSFPGSAQTYDSFADYAADERLVDGGVAYTRYDQYDVTRPLLVGGVERVFWGDRIHVMGGLGLTYARIRDYTNRIDDAIDPATGDPVQVPMARTRLREDCDTGVIAGCRGGRDNFLRFGVSFDTRDYEPDPNNGVFLDVAVDLATVAVGSQYDYVRFLTAARGYWSPFASIDLVLCARVMLQIQSQGTPFFSQSILPFTEDPRTGLGGHRTLRGYRQDRFVGPAMSAANAEIRWTFARTTLRRQKLAFIVVPFFDIGRAFDGASDLTFADWKPSYGGSFRISWNLATIVTADYGRSPEDSGLYINFGHIF